MPTYTNTQWLTQLAADIAALQAGTMTQAQFVTAMQSYTDGWVASASATSASNAASAVQTLVQQVTLRDSNFDAWVGGTLTGGYTDSTGTTLGGPYYPLTSLAGGTVYMMCPAGVQALSAKGNAAGVVFAFNTATAAADPGSGKFAFDNATPASIAHLYLSNTEYYGNDVTAWNASFSVSTTTPNPGVLYLAVNTTNGFLVLKVVGGITNNGTYTTVPVAYVNGSGLPTSGTRLAIVFSPTGNRGAALIPGHGTPTILTGSDGDSYLNLDTGDFWTRTSGVWSGPYSNLNTLFDITALRQMYGKSVAWGILDPANFVGAWLTTDGYFYAKHAVRVPISNGLSFSRQSDGFYNLQLGTVEGLTPFGVAGDGVDTTTQMYFNGLQVLWGVRGASPGAPLFITSDGYVQAKLAVRQGYKNGLSFSRGSDGFYTLSFGSVEGVTPFGTAGDGVDTTSQRYFAGQTVSYAITDPSGYSNLIITADGYIRGKLAIQKGIGNGLTVTRDAFGMTSISLGATENQLPIGAAGGTIDSSQGLYFANQLVMWGVQGNAGGTPLLITADGYVRGKYAIQLGVANGLSFTKDSFGMYTLSLGAAANQLPLGSAGDLIDTTGLRYYNGKQVAFARQDTQGLASYVETIDGDVYIPKLQSSAVVLGGPLDLSTALFTVALVSQKAQIFRTNKSTWAAPPTQLTSSGNNTNPVASADGSKVIYTSDRNGGRDLYYQKTDGTGAEHPYFPVSSLGCCFGDSLTQGTGATTGHDYPTDVGALSGRVFTNKGIGGQTSTHIAMRYGGVAANLTVSGNQISGGANSVTAINGVSIIGMSTGQAPDYRFLSTAADDATRSMTGFLAGVHGVLTRTATGGPPSTSETYTFTPDTAPGSPVSCPAGTPFIIDTGGVDDQFVCFWLGRNNYTYPTQVKSDIAGCVAFFKPIAQQFVVMSVLNGNFGANEISGGTGYNTITTLNSDLSTLYPNNYVDVRAALVAAYNSANPVDVIDHGNDVPPFSLRALYSGGTLPNAVAATDTSFSVSGLNVSANQILTVGSEYIQVLTVSGSTVTNCTRGYAGTTAAAYSPGQSFQATDNIHLSNAGYQVVANTVYTFAHGKGWI